MDTLEAVMGIDSWEDRFNSYSIYGGLGGAVSEVIAETDLLVH